MINNMTNVISCVIVIVMISTNLMFSHSISNFCIEIVTTSENELITFEFRTKSTQGGLAAQDLATGGAEVHPRRGVANVAQSTTRSVEIPTWVACFRPFDSPPDLQNDKDRGAAVPDHALSSSPILPSPFLALLPMWHLDSFGHHRAACHVAGVLGRRGYALECAAAQMCREAGARITTNMFVRDMDLGHFNALDARRLEIVADGLTLWRGAPLISSLFPRWGAKGLRDTGQSTSMVQHWLRLASARRGPTLNSVAKEVGPVWLCWPSRLEVDGAWRQLSSSPRWRMHGLSQSLSSSEVGWQLHGPAGGGQCLRAALSEPSLCLCWIDVPCRTLVTCTPPHKRSCETTGSRSLVRLTSSPLRPWRRWFCQFHPCTKNTTYLK